MATLIAWTGVVLGLIMGGGLAFLLFRQRLQSKPGSAAPEGLYLGGIPEDETPIPPASEPLKAASEAGPKPEPGEKPAEVETIPIGVVKKSLSDRLRVPTGLQGNLAQVPVHDFLQFLAQGKRTGLLEVISGRRHGYIKMAMGQIDHAVFRGRTGVTAIFALLSLTEGDFEFFEGGEANYPGNLELGEPHAPVEVLEVLLRWESQAKKPATSEPQVGES